MTIFYWKTKDGFNSTPFLEQAIHYYHQRQDKEQAWKKWGMKKPIVSVDWR